MYNIHTLSNGLRVIHLQTTSEVVYCGYAINAGTRHEQAGEDGLAHFCEHASFKGTARRKAWQVNHVLDAVGGDLNAETSKEHTIYYSVVQREHVARAIDILTDIVFHSTYSEQELEREKDVVCDEIESYNDSPSDLIYDDIENIIFANHPLGHNILGTRESVQAFSTVDVRRFTSRYYHPDNMVFFLSGNIDFARVVRMLEKWHATITSHMPLDTANGTFPVAQTVTGREGYHQAHVILSSEAYSANDPQRIAASLMNNILGGPAISSRLNMALRERNGLVYTVESSIALYSDTGIWTVYFGCDQHDVDRCLRLVRREFDRLTDHLLTPRQLLAAQRQMCGQLSIAAENKESAILGAAKGYLHNDIGWRRSLQETCQMIKDITADDLQRVAQHLLSPDNQVQLIFR